VAHEMGLGKTFTSVATPIICKLLTQKIVMGLPLSILWGNTLGEWVSMAQNNFPWIIGDELGWYPVGTQNSVPSHLPKVQSTQPQGHPAQTSAWEPILVMTMPGVAETFKNVIDGMTYVTDVKLVNLLHTEYAYLTHEDLNTSIDAPEN